MCHLIDGDASILGGIFLPENRHPRSQYNFSLFSPPFPAGGGWCCCLMYVSLQGSSGPRFSSFPRWCCCLMYLQGSSAADGATCRLSPARGAGRALTRKRWVMGSELAGVRGDRHSHHSHQHIHHHSHKPGSPRNATNATKLTLKRHMKTELYR